MSYLSTPRDLNSLPPAFKQGDTVMYRQTDATGHAYLREAVVGDVTPEGNSWAYRLRSDQENSSPPASIHNRKSPFLRPPKRHRLPVVVAGTRTEAIPDTGAMVNAITEDFLNQLKAEVHPETGREDNVVQIGNDTSASALHQVSPSLGLLDDRGFAGEEQPWSFHVFRKLAAGVTLIIGRPFLNVNEIMTSRSHLLREVHHKMPSPPRCMSMGPVTRSGLRMRVYINTKPVMALPDTGSEVDLISRPCVNRLGLDIIPLGAGDTRMIEFADGTIVGLSGKAAVQFDTHKAPKRGIRQSLTHWNGAQARSQDSNSYDHIVTFYVLDNLSNDVTLSQQLLFALDAFNQHASSMRTVNVGNSLQTIFEHGEKITELSVYDLKQIRKINQGKRTAREKELRQQLANTQDQSEKDEVEGKLNDLERLCQEEKQEYEDALREMERKLLPT